MSSSLIWWKWRKLSNGYLSTIKYFRLVVSSISFLTKNQTGSTYDKNLMFTNVARSLFSTTILQWREQLLKFKSFCSPKQLSGKTRLGQTISSVELYTFTENFNHRCEKNYGWKKHWENLKEKKKWFVLESATIFFRLFNIQSVRTRFSHVINKSCFDWLLFCMNFLTPQSSTDNGTRFLK